MIQPKTSYARNGEVNIAYQVIGDGPLDLLFTPPAVGFKVTVPALAPTFCAKVSVLPVVKVTLPPVEVTPGRPSTLPTIKVSRSVY